jgi:flagellar hook-associated protein 3 FlgL
MLRSIDSYSDRFLESLRALNQRQERAVRQLSSGKRVQSVSDDPDAVAVILQARAQTARLEQIQANLNRLRTETDAAEGALQQAVKLMDRVRSLGAAATGTQQTAETRAGIAGEIADILERLVGLANTEIDGRFIFSGDSDATPPLGALDFAQSPPWGVYQGAAATRRAEHPTGIQFDVSRTAGDIFTNADPAKNVLQKVEDLRQALLANDDQAIRDAIAPLARVSSHLNAELMFYGNVQNQLAESVETASKMTMRLAAELSSHEDTDVTETIVELQQIRFQQQAALQAKGSLPRTSLFDYLR